MPTDRSEKNSEATALKKGAWFGSLHESLQNTLVENARTNDYAAGTVISGEDRTDAAMRAVLAGQVSVTRQVGSDKNFLFHIGGPGFWFGELALFAKTAPVVTVTARVQSRILTVSKNKLRQMLRQEPAYYECFMELMANRQALLMRALAQGVTLSPEECLRIKLADIADLWRRDGFDGEFVDLVISRSELAAMVGVTRQYVGQFLQLLENERLIEIGFRSIRIRDSAGLRGSSRSTGLDVQLT